MSSLGQQVKQGDLLVSLDPELARSDGGRPRPRWPSSALIDSRNVDPGLLRKELARQRRLMAGDATTGVDLERAEAEVAKPKPSCAAPPPPPSA